MLDKKVLFAVGLFLISFLSYSLIPIYEKEDENFKFLLFQKNNYWHDGLSPLITAYFKNYLLNKTFSLSNETIVDENYNLRITNYVDIFCSDGLCYPNFYNFGLHGFFELSYWLNKITKLEPLRFLILSNIVIFSISIVLLFLLLSKICNKNIHLLFIITIVIGLATSFIIYSKYLFLHNSFQTLFFILFLYFLIKFEKKKHQINFIFLIINIVLFTIFYQALPAIILLIFFLTFLLFFYKKYFKTKILLSTILFFLLLIIANVAVFLNYFKFIREKDNFLYKIFKQNLFAVDLKINAITYSISNSLGNAIFLKTYSLFGYFFGPKGIFVNSPFLIFSFFGMLSFKRTELRNKLLVLLLFMVLFLAYINPDFEGGFSPRYVRHSELIISILSIFLANLILKKNLSKLFLFIVVILVIVSVLNTISLSIRSDWNYEKITDLISYDAVLWPWISLKEESITLDLTKLSEQVKWNLTWEEGCNPPITEPRFSQNGLELAPCYCSFKNYASRNIKIPKSIRYMEIDLCSKFAGGDGIIFEVSIDKTKNVSYYIKSNECQKIYLDLNEFADENFHTIIFSTDRNFVCDFESLYIKELNFLKEANVTEDINFIKNSWNWKLFSVCKSYWLNSSITTEKCYCSEPSYATTTLDFKKETPFLNIEACADESGKDGALAKIIIDNSTYEFLISSKDCIKKSILVSDFKEGKINLILTTETFGYCSNERVFWRYISFGREPLGDLVEEKYSYIYNLQSFAEQVKWNLTWEEGCNPPITEPRFSEVGIETGPCACTFKNNVTREIFLSFHVNALKISACSKFSGGDGTLGYIYLDNKEVSKFQIDSSTCKDIIVDVTEFANNSEHKLTLESSRNKECNEEVIIWRKVELIKFDGEFPKYEFDVLNEIEKWNSSNTLCPAEFRLDSILTDYCYCSDASVATYYFNVKNTDLKLKVTACTAFAGGDGVVGEILIDDKIVKEMFLKSNECNTIIWNVKLSPGNHILKLKPKIYGSCDAEIIRWKKIIFT